MKNKLRDLYISLRARFHVLLDNLFGNTDYKKFVIVSDARTGSTLVNNMLNFHPNVIAKGEAFREIHSQSSLQVWDELFRKYPRAIKFVGFKLFYQHPIVGDKDVWEIIKRDRSIIVLHLIRKNILRTLVSKKIGLKTRKWTENVHSKESIALECKRIKLNAEECERYFEEIEKYQNSIEEVFYNHKLIPITYEDLANDRKTVINGIFREFGLDEYERDSELKKQNPESLHDLIVNFKELENYFRGTKWEVYFNEEQQ